MNYFIAVPTRDNVVDNHFGHCDHYSLFEIDENKTIVQTKKLSSPEGCGCKSGIAPVLKSIGVKVMLAGNIGQGAINVLSNNEIQVIRGCSGDVKSLVEAYLAGNITDNGTVCDHHECH